MKRCYNHDVPGNKKMFLFVFGVALVLIAASGGVWWSVSRARGCNPPLLRQTVKIGGTSFDVEMARVVVEQSCGLSGRSGLGENQGMLFVFGSGGTRNFWMKDMNFPIDMIWISKGKVVGFVENADQQIGAPLWKLKIYTSPPNVDNVLEVIAGVVAKKNIKVGDMVVF